MHLPLARLQFQQTLLQPEIHLARAALYIAQEEYPALDVDDYLHQLDQIAATISDRLPVERYPLKVLQTINQHLYDHLGFVGNSDNYYDPDNSFLNKVLDRRTGIPITLSLVYLEVARRLQFPMVGVGFPGHFLIRPDLPEMEIYVDAFHQGEILFAEDCQARLQEIAGTAVELKPHFFRVVTPQQFLVRLLTNLKQIYLEQGDMSRCLAVVERIVLVTPDAYEQIRDRGILYYQLGQWVQAKQDLQTYLDHVTQPTDQALIRQLLRRISGPGNPLL